LKTMWKSVLRKQSSLKPKEISLIRFYHILLLWLQNSAIISCTTTIHQLNDSTWHGNSCDILDYKSKTRWQSEIVDMHE